LFFKEYTDRYDPEDTRVRLKIEHTYRVAQIAERIAVSLKMDRADTDLAWLLGMLHDVGRFEQLRRYDTFLDSASVDHAKLGADILFDEGLIQSFTGELTDEESSLAEEAIRLHNRLMVPDEYEGRSRVFINLLRDADKADIFRVMVTIPYEERGGRAAVSSDPQVGEEFMEYVMAHRCIPYAPGRSRFEAYIAHCCMAFELVYPETVVIVKEQGYLETLLNGSGEFADLPKDSTGRKQLAIMKIEIEKQWDTIKEEYRI
jgi:putative nucleotidyltransferase with HDIG domain